MAVGDVVVRVEGELYHPVRTSQKLLEQAGESVLLTILRQGIELDVRVPRSVAPIR